MDWDRFNIQRHATDIAFGDAMLPKCAFGELHITDARGKIGTEG